MVQVLTREVGREQVNVRLEEGFGLLEGGGDGGDKREKALLDPVFQEVGLATEAAGNLPDTSRRCACSKRCPPAE